MVGIITTPEAEIEQKREVKLTNGSGAPTQGTTANGFSEAVGAFVVPADQRYGTGVTVPVQPVLDVRPPWGNGIVKVSYDATANDSDKVVLTCPADKICVVIGVSAVYAATADVGNRRVGFYIYNSAGNLLWPAKVNAPHVASGTQNYLAVPGGFVTTSTLWETNTTELPDPCIMLPGQYLRVWDTAAIAAGADDMTTAITYIEYDA